MRREASFHGKFRHFISFEFPDDSAAFEVKQTTTDSLPFSAVKEHQELSLEAAKHGSLTFKPSDEARGFKPCDFLHLAGVQAYIVIKYPKGFVLIDIDKWIEERKTSTRKSLTWDRAKEIADMIR